MSALLPIADIAQHGGDVRFVPKADPRCSEERHYSITSSAAQTRSTVLRAASRIFAGDDVSGRDEYRLTFCRSSIGAWTFRYSIVPAGQMSNLRSYLYVCQPAADVGCDKRSNIGDREAVAGNKLMPVQFAIHPLKPLISYRPLRFAIFRELLKAALKDWTGVLNRAPDRGE